jgi:hypothetical protein
LELPWLPLNGAFAGATAGIINSKLSMDARADSGVTLLRIRGGVLFSFLVVCAVG